MMNLGLQSMASSDVEYLLLGIWGWEASHLQWAYFQVRLCISDWETSTRSLWERSWGWSLIVPQRKNIRKSCRKSLQANGILGKSPNSVFTETLNPVLSSFLKVVVLFWLALQVWLLVTYRCVPRLFWVFLNPCPWVTIMQQWVSQAGDLFTLSTKQVIL